MAAAQTYMMGGTSRKMFLYSGQYTSIIRSSLPIVVWQNGPSGITGDGVDSASSDWSVADDIVWWSGQFTSTIHSSLVLAPFVQWLNISATTADTMVSEQTYHILIHFSGKTTSTMKSSHNCHPSNPGHSPRGQCVITNNDHLFFSLEHVKMYHMSGTYTSTWRDSQGFPGFVTAPRDISWNGYDTMLADEGSDKLVMQSGLFTTTVKISFDVSADDLTPRGIEEYNMYTRLLGASDGNIALSLPAFVVLGYTGASGELSLPQFNVQGEEFNRANVSITLSLLIQAIEGPDQNANADLTLPIFLHDFAGHEVIDIEVTFPALGGVEIGAAFLVGRAYTGTPPKCSVMNTKNFAVSEYKDFAFNSMTRFNGSEIVAGQNGIYELDDTDSDDTDVDSYKIKCHIKTGVVDTYDRVISRMRDAYLTYRGEDAMELSVLADKSSNRHYTIENNYSNDNLIKIKRIKFERGIKNRHFDFKIANIVGGAMEIEKLKIALEPILSKRR